MELPESDESDIARLSSVFSETTNSYKFYWLMAILDGLRETGQIRFSMQNLSLRMVANVWYPLDYFKLSFGKQDGFKPIADFVSERITVDNRPTAKSLFSQINAGLSAADLIQLHRKVSVLSIGFHTDLFALFLHRRPVAYSTSTLTPELLNWQIKRKRLRTVSSATKLNLTIIG